MKTLINFLWAAALVALGVCFWNLGEQMRQDGQAMLKVAESLR